MRGYPDHGFANDREKLKDLGIPVRGPTPEEAPVLAKLASALDRFDDKETVIELVDAAETVAAAA